MTLNPEALPATPTRRRAMAWLVVGVASMNITMSGASTAATLISAQVVGESWSGVTSAFAVGGTALGSLALANVMARCGRRVGLVVGYITAILGALIAAVGAAATEFPLLLLGMALIGFGNSAVQLARYAAADLYPEQQRGSALGFVVWAGTIGAFLGPSLMAPAAGVAGALRFPEMTGSFMLGVLMTMLASTAGFLLPRKTGLPAETRAGVVRERPTPGVTLALVAMVCAQVAMVAMMTMTPVHMHNHGHSLGSVGVVLSAHMLGMTALSPLTGKLADRLGGGILIAMGCGTLIFSTVLAALAGPSYLPAVALFLLGYGWNLCFVGGSSILAKELPVETRIRMQGRIDAMVWGSSAFASLGSGLVLAHGSFAWLSAVAGLIALLPLVRSLTGRRRIEYMVISDPRTAPPSFLPYVKKHAYVGGRE